MSQVSLCHSINQAGFGCYLLLSNIVIVYRFEIEKKLRQQKRLERARDKPYSKPKDKDREKTKKKEEEKVIKEKAKPSVKEVEVAVPVEEEEEGEEVDEQESNKLQVDFSSIDHKERSKERKKNIEENRGKTDNKRFDNDNIVIRF